jgi:hypothetical protein
MNNQEEEIIKYAKEGKYTSGRKYMRYLTGMYSNELKMIVWEIK